MFDDRWAYPDPDRNDEAGKKLAILKGAARAADMTDDVFKAKFMVITLLLAAASLHALESEARFVIHHAATTSDASCYGVQAACMIGSCCCTGAQHPPAGDVITEIAAAGQGVAGAASVRHLRCVREAMLPCLATTANCSTA